MKKIEEQLKAIFGDDFEMVRDDAFAKLDDTLEQDLSTAIGFDPTAIRKHVVGLFDSLSLTRAQRALVLTDIFARSSEKDHVARVINIRTLEGNLAAMLVKSANEAGEHYQDLLDASLDNIEDAAEVAATLV